MPLESGSSREVVGRNIKREKAAGKSQKQAVAIALHEAGVPRKGGKKVQKSAAVNDAGFVYGVPVSGVTLSQVMTGNCVAKSYARISGRRK